MEHPDKRGPADPHAPTSSPHYSDDQLIPTRPVGGSRLSEDQEMVLGQTTGQAVGLLQDAGMGRTEATEFLVECSARHVLGLDGSGRFFRASEAGDMTQILKKAVVGAWESGAITDSQHDAALVYLNDGDVLSGSE